MIKIYEIQPDIKHCQWAMPNDKNFIRELMSFDGKSKLANWNPPKFHIFNSVDERADFYHIASACFAFSENVFKNIEIRTSLEYAGEILPIKLETGESLYILNVTSCVDALDIHKSEYSLYWDVEKNAQAKGAVTKYVFHKDRLSSSSIFKIPDLVKAKIFVTKGWPGLICESFIDVYNQQKFTGLIFEEVWSIETPEDLGD